jgi:RNA polymerase sigma-70 factor (ECF subfamily)
MEEKELIRRSQKGDGEAFGTLVERYKGKVFNLAYGFARDRAEADDLAQEIFIKAYFALPKFRFESEFGTWLYRIAMNHIKDHLRKSKTRSKDISLQDVGEQALAAESPGPEQRQDEERRRAIVAEAVRELPEKYRAVVTLRDIEGFSYEDIARILRLSPGTVDSRLHRGRRKLREKLAAQLSPRGGENGM